MNNLITLCQTCHRWGHKLKEPDEIPVKLSDVEYEALSGVDYELLTLFYEEGPLPISEIKSRLNCGLEINAIREHLWILMSLDNQISTREKQLIDQSSVSRKWGLADQIKFSQRDRIPAHIEEVLLRAEDERVRRALDDGYEHDFVADVFDISLRSTYYKKHRARAFDFPLEELKPTSRPKTLPGRDIGDGGVWSDPHLVQTFDPLDETESYEGYVKFPGVLVPMTETERDALMADCAQKLQPVSSRIKAFIKKETKDALNNSMG